MNFGAIVCEGYQDRAFFSGWLDYLYSAKKYDLPKSHRLAGRGIYCKQIPQRPSVVIVPAEGKSRVAQTAADYAKNGATELSRVLIVIDSDGLEPSASRSSMLSSYCTTRGIEPPAAEATLVADRKIEVRVEVLHPSLERVIRTALGATYADEMRAVDDFLGHQPNRPAKLTGKEPAFTYCAAWCPDSFGDDFFAHVWRDPQVRDALLLRTTEMKTSLDWLLGS